MRELVEYHGARSRDAAFTWLRGQLPGLAAQAEPQRNGSA
jgi:hypothetical protein